MHRNDFLDIASKLINGPRAEDYGDVLENHERIAKIWSVILGCKVSPAQVILCMTGVKIARLVEKNDSQDGWTDIIGYGALGGEITSSPEAPDPQTTKLSTYQSNKHTGLRSQ